ncbi:hypothetical protein ACVBEH_20135, partial [Roseateles sp. GG27B]
HNHVSKHTSRGQVLHCDTTAEGQVCVCHAARTMKGVQQDVRNFDEDEGRPLEVGVQARASNRPELRGSRAQVVSVEPNFGARSQI